MTTTNNNYIFKPVEIDGIKNCKQKFYILILFKYSHKLKLCILSLFLNQLLITMNVFLLCICDICKNTNQKSFSVNCVLTIGK